MFLPPPENFCPPLEKVTDLNYLTLKLRCDERFPHAFFACGCVFNKRILKTTLATQLKRCFWRNSCTLIGYDYINIYFILLFCNKLYQ